MKVLDTLKKYLNDIEGQVQELQEPEGTESPGPVETKVFKRRWYILALYSLLCCHQCTVWNTYGPITKAVMYAYDWPNSTIAMMANWGTIIFCLFTLPILWMQQKCGLRATVLLSCGTMTVGSIIRVFSLAPTPYLISAHLGAILNGLTGIIVMAAPAALSAAWFPADQRTTATAVSQMANGLGNGVSFLLGPKMVPDHCLNMTGENTVVISDDCNGLPPSKEDVRQDIWWYMVVLASASTVIFVAMVAYFPSKPSLPPSQSASEGVNRTPFTQSIKELFTNWNAILCMIALSLSCGVEGAWSGVMAVNFEPLGVDDSHVGFIGALGVGVTAVCGVIVAQFMDRFRRHIKLTCIIMGAVSTACFTWLMLIVLKVIPFEMWQLYVSTITGITTLYTCMPLFMEYTNEMTYPVPEGIVGGFLTFFYNLVGIVFYLMFFIPNLGVTWMNYAIVASCFSIIPLIWMTKERYNRLDLDD